MTPTPPPDAWVFDWNGTIVDDARRALSATNRVLSERRLPTIDAAAFTRTFRLPMTAFMAALGIPRAEREEAVSRWNDLMAQDVCGLADGARNLLEALASQGITIVVLSAAAPTVVEADAIRLGIRSLLHRIVADAADKAAELRALADELGRLVFVGDTVEDIRAGTAAGVWTIAYTGGYLPEDRLRAAGPDAMCDDLAVLAVS